MSSLVDDLKSSKNTLNEFREIAERSLNYMLDMIDETIIYNDYKICSSTTAGTRKTIRPLNMNLFIADANQFKQEYNEFEKCLLKIREKSYNFQKENEILIDRVVYTIQQAIGVGFDLVVESNSARKHVGNRFEELIRTIFRSLDIKLKKIVLSIPYHTEQGESYYKCETDIVLSPFDKVKSTSLMIDPNEIVISLKTTTKDRMPKIFIDKLLMEKFLDRPVKMVGISQNDIQRKEGAKPTVNTTFVANLFMVYTQFLTDLNGYYYMDLPHRAKEEPFNRHIFRFSKLITKDVWDLLNS
jgi:hypothetical protein